MSIAPNFNDIAYFIEVAQTKNISRAAERLGITQPSLSTAMKRLEDSLGTILLLRGRGGVQLTKSGQDFLSKARQLLSEWDQLKSEVKKKESEAKGQYSIGCHPSVALYSLTNFLPELLTKYNELEIKLTHDLSRKITERVISFDLDFGIVVNPVPHPDLVITELCKDEVTFWTIKKPSENQNMKSAKAVLLADINLSQVQKLLTDLTKKKVKFERLVESSNLEVIAELTAKGTGIGILPSRVATRVKTNQLVKLSEKMPLFKDRICLIYRADFQKTKGSKIIIQAIKDAKL